MGYSIGIRTRSETLKTQMLAFMEREYRSWPYLETGNPNAPCYASPPTDDLYYDSRAKSALGVNYGSVGGWERDWAYIIVRWMALKVGTRRTSFSNGIHIEKPTPFMVYDGHETWPILVCTAAEAKKLPQRLQCYAVDAQGFHNGPRAEIGLVQNVLWYDKVDPNTHMNAVRKVGPCPEKGDPLVWRNKLRRALLDEPGVRPALDKRLKTFRDELTRLTLLWDAL